MVAISRQTERSAAETCPFAMNARSVRLAAALIALCAGIGVGAGFTGVFGRTGSAPLAIWIMVAYFTNLTGVVVAVLFGGIALGLPALARPRLVAGAALATLLVGLVQRLLLYRVRELRGGDLVGDILLHQALPVLVPLFWLALVPKGRLSPRDPLLFAAYPLTYLGYTLIRGAYDARYPYPFLDVGKIGWGPVAAYAGAIAVAFLAVGWAMVALDRLLAVGARRRAARS